MAGRKEREDPGPSVKDADTYEALRDQGASKEKAARIANARAKAQRDGSREDPSRKGGRQPPYEEWTVDDLRERAAELDVEGRSSMTKDELVEALRER